MSQLVPKRQPLDLLAQPMVVRLCWVALLEQVCDKLGRLDAEEHNQVANGGRNSSEPDNLQDWISMQYAVPSVYGCGSVQLDQKRTQKTLETRPLVRRRNRDRWTITHPDNREEHPWNLYPENVRPRDKRANED